ncbi:MAG: gliding motility-associated C-terminal domain-containing protein, partial [FCB group bacterium]|nr:gliding motility-associated C-terminal domain-containing protein [FCB group bacterium]
PQVRIVKRPRVVRRGEPLEIVLGSVVENTTYDWKILSKGPITIYTPEGNVTPTDPGEERPIQSGYQLNSNNEAALVSFAISPAANGCDGPADTVSIKVLPAANDIFIPEAMTPNNDGTNDTWLITLADHIDARDYVLELFNRSGGKVLSMNPLRNDWNAELLPDGVYWWLLKDLQQSTLQAGGLTIRRK